MEIKSIVRVFWGCKPSKKENKETLPYQNFTVFYKKCIEATGINKVK